MNPWKKKAVDVVALAWGMAVAVFFAAVIMDLACAF
jgi:hypothetical protein